MFRNLFNFAYKRTPKEAFGFYVAYLLLLMAAAGLVASYAIVLNGSAGATFEEGFKQGMKVGPVVASVGTLLLSALILFKKDRLTFVNIVIAIVSSIIALIVGGLVGLIPVAYFTTLEARS